MKSFFTKLSVLLFGVAFAVAGCQDYDEDIRKVNDQLNANTAELTSITDALDKAIKDLEAKMVADYATKKALADLSAELKAEIDADVAAAKTALEAAYKAADAVLKSGYEAADAALKTELQKAIADAKAEANTAVQNLQKSLENAQAQMQQGLKDANDYTAMIEQYVMAEFQKVNKAITDLNKTVDDLDAAYKAADAGLQKNIDAAIAKAAADLLAAKTELTAAYEAAIKTAVEKLEAEIAKNAAAITALTTLHKNDVALLQAAIAENSDDITALLLQLNAFKSEYQTTVDLLQGAIAEGDEAVRQQLTNALNAHIEVYEETVDLLQGAIAEGDEAVRQQLTNAINALDELHKADVANLQGAIAENTTLAEGIRTQLLNHIAEYKATIEQLENQVTANEGEIAMLKVRALAVEAQVEALQALHATDMENMQNVLNNLEVAIQQETAQRQAAIEEIDAKHTLANEEILAYVGELEHQIRLNAAAIKNINDVNAAQDKAIEDLGKQLETLRKELKEYYALKTDVTTTKEELNKLVAKVAQLEKDAFAKINDINSRVNQNTEDLKKAIAAIAELRVDVDELLARIQSLVFAPDYTRNVAFIEYAMIVGSSKTDGETEAEAERLPKLSLIRYKVNAKDAATEAKSIALAWNQNNEVLSYTLESVATSRAAVENNEELVIRKVEASGEYLYVWVTAENFNECFYTGRPENNEAVNSYAASLRFSDGNNELATEYVVLAPIDEPMEIEVSIKHDVAGDTVYDSYAQVDSTLAVNDVETIHPVLEGHEAVLTSGGKELTEEELAMFPSTEIAFEEERTYTNPNEEYSISDDSFTFTGEEMTETVQLAEALNKDYVGDVLHITRTYTFGPSVATATFNEKLTAEKRETTIVPDTKVVDWTLQRALDLRGDDKTPYSKTITIPAKYEFSYNLNDVFKSSDLELPLVTEVTCNGKATSAWVGLTNYEGTAPNFTVNCNLHNYEFPAPGEKPNVYRVVWKATLGNYLYVVADLEITLNPRPSTVEITREVPLQLVPGTSYFEAPDALVNAAYVALTPENAGFNTANLAKPNAVLLAALNDGDNTVTNTPNYSTNLNFVVGEGDVDNSFVRLYNEQIKGNVPADSYEFERVIDPTWFGVPFIFNVTAKPQLPDYGLIASEDYMKTDEDGIAYVEVFGKINSEGIYTIDLADLGKYLGVTVGNGADKTRKLEHNLDVEFEIVKGDVKLADNEVAVIPEEGPVAEKSGILRFGQLTADEAVVDWDQYAGTVVDVKATLKTSAAEGAYVLDTKDFQLRTADPLSFEFGDTIRVTRVPGMSASAKVYENVVLKSSVEPSVQNLVDQEATSIMEIFAKSHADKTYGIDTEVRIWGVYVDEAMTVPYSSQKWSKDETNGTVTLNADDGQLLYNIYAKATLEFKHNIHGVCTASKDIVIVFEPSADAKVMMNKFTNGGEIKLDDNLLLTQPLVIDNPNAVVTLDLGGKTIQNISKENGSEQYALRVKQGTLIIKGEGTVDGGSGCLYNIALRVDGPAVAYIEGGHFKVGADQDGDQNHCIYAADGGKVFISGGKFQSAPKKGTVPAEYTTLNLKDNTGASIEVTGGEFVNFNPGAITFEPGVTSFVKAGYKAILKQYSTTDYIVVAE